MPIYEYECKNDHKFEKLEPITLPLTATRKCPDCGEIAKRVPSVAGGIIIE